VRSAQRGKSTSLVEVTNVSITGFWLLLEDEEIFVAFKEFPWFKEASIRELVNVELPSPDHLWWPDLDVDLAVESLAHPERFPLLSKARPNSKNRRISRPRSRPRWSRLLCHLFFSSHQFTA
jgi:Protein of unknown function (DUF2442)